ncbi:efflux transporter outer membrane subunit [Castellaniella hirudinis]|uniref:efflux transporter outer membrane subunit n=1 Tax=Castellaniella hirudinis TaxID=1144617 RepID=UPI0039C16F30
MKPYLPLLLALALSACAPMDPGAPQVAALSGETLALNPDGAVSWPNDDWWTRYQDVQLNQLIDQALAGNPGLQAAAARVRAAQAAARGARAVQWPQVNANYHLTRERLSENYIYPPPLGGSYQSDTGLTLQLDFNPDLWGRQAALSQAARTRAAAAEAARQQAHTLIVSAVAQAYFQLQNAQAQSAAIEAIVGKLQEALDITRDRYRNGLGIQVDVDQADSAVSSARVQLSQARNNAQLMHHQLAALLGKSPGQLPVPAPTPYQTIPAQAPAPLPVALLGRRADIAAARLQAVAAGAEISAAKADFLPNISLSAAAGYLSLGMDQLFRSRSEQYSAGPVITLPIFNAGALNAQLAGRRAARDEAIAQYNETVLGAIREVADAQASIQSLHTQIQHQEASLKAITSAYDVALQRYKAGLGNFVQVLMAQSEALKQTVQTTDLHAQAYILDVQLASALGGGYQAPAADTAAHSFQPIHQ